MVNLHGRALCGKWRLLTEDLRSVLSPFGLPPEPGTFWAEVGRFMGGLGCWFAIVLVGSCGLVGSVICLIILWSEVGRPRVTTKAVKDPVLRLISRRAFTKLRLPYLVVEPPLWKYRQPSQNMQSTSNSKAKGDASSHLCHLTWPLPVPVQRAAMEYSLENWRRIQEMQWLEGDIYLAWMVFCFCVVPTFANV